MATKPAVTVPLGPGTVTLGDTPFDFSCEVRGGSVTHNYDTDDPETMLCGDIVPGKATRTDGLEFSLYNDLSSTGLYKYLMDHDLEKVAFVYTPNTANGAKWQGHVRLTLPDSVGADEYGANIGSEVAWEGTDLFTFTPSTAAASPAAGNV